jgi:hypothetical protein
MSECDCGRVENGRHHTDCPASGNSIRKRQVMSEVLTPKVSARFEVDQYLFDCAKPIFGHCFTDYEKHALLHRFISLFKTIDDLRQRAEQADASADTYTLLLRKLTKDDTLLAAYRRSKKLDHRGVPVVSDAVLEMLRQEEANTAKGGE